MRVLHLCLSCFYIDGYQYQENILPKIHKEQGHDVKIIASTETFIDNMHLGHTKPGTYTTEYGVSITRLPYKGVLGNRVNSKLRYYRGLYHEIDSFRPDIIMSHDISYGSIDEVIDYVKRHEDVILYADCHADANNSGRSVVSKYVLHRAFYRAHIKKAEPYIKKLLYISEETRQFIIENYRFDEEKLEFYPLGGIIPSVEEYNENRAKKRRELHLDEDDILILHSGKLDKNKKTIELLNAFLSIEEPKIRLAVIGSLGEDIEKKARELMQHDPRIAFLGWKTSEELQEYLCACDIYAQPGTQSATMQQAVCAGCALILYPQLSYKKDYEYGNILWAENEEEIATAIRRISDTSERLENMKRGSKRCAEEFLDYRKLAARIYR